MKYEDVFVLWLIIVCELVGVDSLVMDCCIVCAWWDCYDLCRCVNGASPVRFVLSLFSLCAFLINCACCVCGYTD